MEQKKLDCAKILKIYEDEYTKLAKLQEQLGVFGIDDLAEGKAREFKIKEICKELNSRGKGKKANSIDCPKCGASSCPLDEELNLAPEVEQGKLREKISILSTLISYHQFPEVSRILLGSEVHSASARRALLKKAEIVKEECPRWNQF